MPEVKPTEEMTEKKAFSPIISAMCSRYSWLAAAAIIPAAAAFFMGLEDYGCIIETSAAALIIILLAAAKYAILKKKGITYSDIHKNEKSLDSRLTGSFGDIGGIGSTLGAITAIIYAFMYIYVKDGGIFESEDFHLYLLMHSARAVCIGVMLASITSKKSMHCSLYIILSKVFNADGKELLRKSSRAAHNPDAMNYLRNMAVIRLTASVSVCTVSIMSIASKAGTVFGGVHCALICLFVSLLSDLAAIPSHKGFCEEKFTLWTKKHQGICIANILMFIIISFFMLFSFPSQSVYCDFTYSTQYDYYEEVDNSIHPFSVPDLSDEAASMVTGLFLLAVFMTALTSGCAITEKSDLSGGSIPFRKYKAIFITAAAAVIISVINGLIYPKQAINSLQWLVTVSLVCFMIIVNIIIGAVSGRKENSCGSNAKAS